MDVEQVNPFELVITSTKELEALLVKGWNAVGDGVIQKVNSVQEQLPKDLVGRIRYLGGVRNKLVHHNDFNALDTAKYQLEYIQAKSVLEHLIKEKSTARAAVAQQGNQAAGIVPEQQADKLIQAYNDVDTQARRGNIHPIRGFPWLIFTGFIAVALIFYDVIGTLILALFLVITYVPIPMLMALLMFRLWLNGTSMPRFFKTHLKKISHMIFKPVRARYLFTSTAIIMKKC